MKAAVLTLTRDRLDYTKRALTSFDETAGCEYDHFILDQGSTDGTVGWLTEVWQRAHERTAVTAIARNVGLCRGLNVLMDGFDAADYDVIVRYDPDLIVNQPDTLSQLAAATVASGVILGPQIDGLRNPLPLGEIRQAGDLSYAETTHLGAYWVIPSAVFTTGGYRWDESYAAWCGDERLCFWYREQFAGRCGYALGLSATHDTDQHHVDFPWYFARRVAEGGPE